MFFAELSELDLTRPFGDAEVKAFRKKMDACAVGVTRHPRPLTDEERRVFSRKLGPLQQMKMLQMVGKSKSRLCSAELIDVGNIDVDGKIFPDDDRRRARNRGTPFDGTRHPRDMRRTTILEAMA